MNKYSYMAKQCRYIYGSYATVNGWIASAWIIKGRQTNETVYAGQDMYNYCYSWFVLQLLTSLRSTMECTMGRSIAFCMGFPTSWFMAGMQYVFVHGFLSLRNTISYLEVGGGGEGGGGSKRDLLGRLCCQKRLMSRFANLYRIPTST